MIEFLRRVGMTKTAIMAFGTLLGTTGAVLTEKITFIEAAPLLLTAVLAIFLRDGVAKGK